MWEYNYTDELYHYGVPGMKWGIRRSKQQLSSGISKRKRQNEELSEFSKKATSRADVYRRKSIDVQKRNAPREAAIAKASANKAKYDLKLNKQLAKRNPNPDKVAKYTAKSAKYNNEMLRQQKKLKNNKYQLKAEDLQLRANEAKAKIEKNQNIIDMFSKTLDNYDSEKLKRGRLFMQYMIS